MNEATKQAEIFRAAVQIYAGFLADPNVRDSGELREKCVHQATEMLAMVMGE